MTPTQQAINDHEPIKWNCPKCFALNTEYPNPFPTIAECEQCGHGVDFEKHLATQKALAAHDYETLDALHEQSGSVVTQNGGLDV